jgi:hypothetical protein
VIYCCGLGGYASGNSGCNGAGSGIDRDDDNNNGEGGGDGTVGAKCSSCGHGGYGRGDAHQSP